MNRNSIRTFLILLIVAIAFNSLCSQTYYQSADFQEITKEKKTLDYSNSKQVIAFVEKWEEKAAKSRDSIAIAYVWMAAAKEFQKTKNLVLAESYALKAAGLISRLGLIDEFFYNKYYLASILVEAGQFERAIELSLESVDEFETYEPYNNKSSYHILADAYLSLHNYERMDYYLQKWYELVKEKNIRMDLGFAIYNMQEYYDIAEMYEKASYYQNEFYIFYVESGDEISHIPEHVFITITGDSPEESIIKLNKYLPYHIENKREHFISQTYRHLGKLYLELNDIDSAVKSFEKAVSMTTNVSLENQIDALSGLSEAYSRKGNFELALLSTNQYVTLLDSFKDMQVLAQGNELEAKYENEKNELQIALKETQIQVKNRWLWISAIGVLVVLSLASFIFFLYHKLKLNNNVLSKTIREKETLLQEIHHRVKNNLQVISSLLSLQSKYVKDEKAVSALNEGQNRVESMALIHQNLYRDDNITGVNMSQYIPLLANKIFDSYNIQGENIEIEFDIDNISLDVETVIPIGLVLNELISNALKYAFKNKTNGVLKVILKENFNGLLLSVVDNGIGIKNKENMKGFGTKLIQSFARKLEGEISINGKAGTTVEIIIKKFKRA